MLITVTLMLSYIVYSTNTRKKEVKFVNRVEKQMAKTINAIDLDKLSDTSEETMLRMYIYSIQKELIILDTMLEEGSITVNEDVDYIGRDYNFSFVSQALSGRMSGDIMFEAFWENGISDGEYKFLSALKQSISSMQRNIKEEPRIRKLQSSINEFFNEWNMYRDANLNGSSYYDYLLN
jgi:hypothetical protein